MSEESREWRRITGFPDYEVSNDGLVRRVTESGYRPVKIRKKKNGYMEVKVFLNGKRKYFLVHRLVCTAFNGEAPSVKHQVNHDDGNKENNLYTNLVWSTGKVNQNHARDTGLSNCSYKVIVHNVVEKTTEVYRSIEQVMSKFSLTKSAVEGFIRGYPNAIYNLFYTFELLYSEDSTTIRSDARSIRVKDFVTGTEFTVGSPRLTSYLTKMSEMAVRSNLDSDRLVGGYMFKSSDDHGPFPRYSVDAALMSREDFQNGVKLEHKVIVTDSRTGESREYNSAEEVALAIGIRKNIIYYHLRRQSTTPHQGYLFRRRLSY